jgi:cobalt-zinc-cadmium efflux system outer membrane protein
MLIILSPLGGIAQPLNERQSLELGLQREDFQQLLESRMEQARGDLTRNETWINPELELSREALADETETAIWLRQRLDLSGRRPLYRDAAQAALDAMVTQTYSAHLERAARIRKQFYEALYLQSLNEIFGHWVDKFEGVEATMLKREASGDVSGYDRRRISREKLAMVSRQRENQARYAASLSVLFGILGLHETAGFDVLQGEFIPPPPPPLNDLLVAIQDQPDLLALQHQGEAKRLASSALARAYIPDLTIGVGQKWLDGPAGTDAGLILSAGFELPLFDRRQGDHQRMRAEFLELEYEYELTRRRLEAELRSQWQLAQQTAENARLYHEQSLVTSDELVRIAETAYHNNELGVLELIDAYHNALESEVHALELAQQARINRIELDKLSGEELP